MSPSRVVFVAGLAFVLVATQAAALTPEEKCRAAKLKAAAKLYTGQIGCHAKAVADPAPDSECLDKARTKFATLYAKADGKGPCPGSVDEALAAVEGFVTETVNSGDDCLGEGGTFELTGTFTLQTCVEALSTEAQTRCCSGQLDSSHGFDFASDPQECRGYCSAP